MSAYGSVYGNVSRKLLATSVPDAISGLRGEFIPRGGARIAPRVNIQISSGNVADVSSRIAPRVGLLGRMSRTAREVGGMIGGSIGRAGGMIGTGVGRAAGGIGRGVGRVGTLASIWAGGMGGGLKAAVAGIAGPAGSAMGSIASTFGHIGGLAKSAFGGRASAGLLNINTRAGASARVAAPSASNIVSNKTSALSKVTGALGKARGVFTNKRLAGIAGGAAAGYMMGGEEGALAGAVGGGFTPRGLRRFGVKTNRKALNYLRGTKRIGPRLNANRRKAGRVTAYGGQALAGGIMGAGAGIIAGGLGGTEGAVLGAAAGGTAGYIAEKQKIGVGRAATAM
jgi:hypothetical protein